MSAPAWLACLAAGLVVVHLLRTWCEWLDDGEPSTRPAPHARRRR